MTEFLLVLLRLVIILFVLFTIAAMLTWAERRVLGLLQERYGPNRVGPMGMLQSLADGIKLFTKEDWVPPFADRAIFMMAPTIVGIVVLLSFAVVPFSRGLVVADLNVGVLFFLALSSLGVYSIALAGWASGSKYSLLGSVRAAAQMVSYELSMGLALAGVVMLAGSFSLSAIVEAQRHLPYLLLQPVAFLIFLVAGVAETKRLPFDLPEAENELVAGYHTEYSSMKFALFFIGEYLGVVLISCIAATLFLGGWQGPWLPPIVWFAIKVAALVFVFIWLRASLPRYRYDQLMGLGWKVMLPLALLNILVTGAIALARG
jgi:NADH-quinone oxidoreductase subunit H